jgi:hypothetical protein
MAISLETKLAWFDRGAAAFERTFPGLLKQYCGDDSPRYVCPLCDEPFVREAVSSGDLTAEHVPPESFGGHELLLTCRVCNNTAGSDVDAHARKRENIAEAKNGDPEQRLPVRVGLLGLKLQALLEPSPSGAELRIDRDHNSPAALEHLQMIGVIPAGTPLTIEFSRERYSELRANISWLRSGFLALFSILGYKFSFDPAIRIVKEQLRSPNHSLIDCFMINFPRGSALSHWLLIEISDPHCTAVMFGPHVVMLPPPHDLDFYQRVEADARAQEAGAPRRTTNVLQTIELTRWEPLFCVEIPDSS